MTNETTRKLIAVTAFFAFTFFVVYQSQADQKFSEKDKLQVYKELASILPTPPPASDLIGIKEPDELYTIVDGTCDAAALHLASNQVHKGYATNSDHVVDVYNFAKDMCIQSFTVILTEWRQYVIEQDRQTNPPT